MSTHETFRSIPALVPENVSARLRLPAAPISESDVYARAHQAHFVAGAPGPALLAWDAYLRAYPRGRFAPEARYNRALCLIRLKRPVEAERALEPFARQREGYRQREAQRLLDWLRTSREPASP